jgi:hypothetical protein
MVRSSRRSPASVIDMQSPYSTQPTLLACKFAEAADGIMSAIPQLRGNMQSSDILMHYYDLI